MDASRRREKWRKDNRRRASQTPPGCRCGKCWRCSTRARAATWYKANRDRAYAALKERRRRWGRGGSRKKAIESLIPQIEQTARIYQSKLPVDVYGDLVSAGMLGAVQAACKWDPDRKVPFPAYASRRIRGAMQDWVRWFTARNSSAVKSGKVPPPLFEPLDEG